MTIFRANDRLAEDERILVISDPEEFLLYREREKLRFKGIMMPYNISSSAADAARFCAISEAVPKIVSRYKLTEFTECKLLDDVPEIRPLFEIGNELSVFFERATGGKTARSFRLNSNYPDEFHQHRTNMTLGVLKSGTLCRNEAGVSYAVPNAHVLLFEDISHRAPVLDTATPDPRATFVINYTHPLASL